MIFSSLVQVLVVLLASCHFIIKTQYGYFAKHTITTISITVFKSLNIKLYALLLSHLSKKKMYECSVPYFSYLTFGLRFTISFFPFQTCETYQYLNTVVIVNMCIFYRARSTKRCVLPSAIQNRNDYFVHD